jgi:hypothetical protein
LSFSYNPGTSAQPKDLVRLLIGDTQSVNHVFEDEEILSAFTVQQMTGFQSSMLYSGSQGQPLPGTPVSVLRVAALLLDALASQKARMSISGLLDAKTDFQAASKQLHAQAEAWREIEDNSGAFMIIETTQTGWGFLDRFWKQIQRQSAQ